MAREEQLVLGHFPGDNLRGLRCLADHIETSMLSSRQRPTGTESPVFGPRGEVPRTTLAYGAVEEAYTSLASTFLAPPLAESIHEGHVQTHQTVEPEERDDVDNQGDYDIVLRSAAEGAKSTTISVTIPRKKDIKERIPRTNWCRASLSSPNLRHSRPDFRLAIMLWSSISRRRGPP